MKVLQHCLIEKFIIKVNAPKFCYTKKNKLYQVGRKSENIHFLNYPQNKDVLINLLLISYNLFLGHGFFK